MLEAALNGLPPGNLSPTPPVNSSGYLSGCTTASFSNRLAVSRPAMSSHLHHHPPQANDMPGVNCKNPFYAPCLLLLLRTLAVDLCTATRPPDMFGPLSCLHGD
jgi:hypothetical protein